VQDDGEAARDGDDCPPLIRPLRDLHPPGL
jgi:hypothetical protein